jgi:serine phosphatase RsbU (regulator of sigma subunit)
VLISPQDGAVLVGEHGPLLGIFDSVEFTETVVPMGHGCALVTFTDGIENRQAHAEDRALELLRDRVSGAAAELAEAVASGALPGVNGPDDDVAVVAVRRLS